MKKETIAQTLALKDLVIPESIAKIWKVKMIKGKATIIKRSIIVKQNERKDEKII